MIELPSLRQVVSVVSQFEPSLAELRQVLSLKPGYRSAGMSQFGLVHEVVALEDTFIEVLSPTSDEGPAHRALSRQGDSGYMLAIQVEDLGECIAACERASVRVVHEAELHGNRFAQLHPQDMGTLLEIDQCSPRDSWHYAEEMAEMGSTEVVLEIAAVTIATKDPLAVAARWALVFGSEVDEADGVVHVSFGGRRVVFATAGDAVGVTSVELLANDRTRTGEVHRLAGLEYRFV